MIRYVGGRQRGKKLPGRRPKGVVKVLTRLKKVTKTKSQIDEGAVQEWDSNLGELEDL